MPSGHEIGEEIEHIAHGNRNIALLVVVLALFLALAATGAKSTQTEAISENLNSANLWMFFQSNGVQRAVVRTSAEAMEARPAGETDDRAKAVRAARADAWKKQLARYDNDPQTKQGREQLMAVAREAEHKRDRAMERYHLF